VVIESSVDSRSRSEDCVAGGGGVSHAQSIG
jgi:hypothetical protein